MSGRGAGTTGRAGGAEASMRAEGTGVGRAIPSRTGRRRDARAHGASHRRSARFRRHGLIRPTIPCLVLVACGAVLCYLGLLLDERALMAATVALAAMIVVAFATVLSQWCRGVPRADRTVTPQYERLDQHGRVVGRVVGDVPDERGLYRRRDAVVRWTAPFGLFAASRLEPRTGETLVLPEADAHARRDAARVAGRRVAGPSQSEQMGSVRAYAPGDPIKLISWKHTARRGSLMTRETGRDERATLLLVLNSRGVEPPRMDAEVAALLPFLDLAARGGVGGRGEGVRVAVTDGVSFHEGGPSARRFLAAVCADRDEDGDGDGRTGGTDSGGRGGASGVGAESPVGTSAVRASASSPDVSASPRSDAARAAAVNRYVQGRSGPVSVLISDASPAKGLERAIAATPSSDHMRAVDPSRSVPERFDHAAVSGPDATPTSPTASFPASRHRVPPAWLGRVLRSMRALDAVVPAVVSALSPLIAFGVTLKGLSGLVAPTGAWIWFAAALLGVAAIESSIPWGASARRVPRVRLELVRVGAYALLTLLATAVLLVVRLHALTGDWLFSPAQRGDVWRIVTSAVSGGFDALNLQLPPLKVPVAGDVFLILAVALAAVAIRCLLVARIAAPAMSLLAVAALAADYSIVGHVAPWWAIVALAVAFPMGVWAARPRGLRPFAVLVASLVVMAVTVAGTPSAETLAYNVPLSIGEGGGMFSSNTVSPMIDLKRNIAAGSDTVVLDYRSYKRMYLRMTTLDQFDGDTWGYDKDLALDAGLYGAGIQLGLDSSNELSDRDRRVDNPLSAYMRMLGYYGYDVAGVNQDTLEQFMGYARVRIATLRSRFLPIPGIYTGANGVGSDWLSYRDGSVYNRSGSTSEGTSYTASGVYLDPISSSSGFGQLTTIESTIAALKKQSEQGGDDGSRRRWLAARRSLSDSGLAEISGDTAYIHAVVGADGTVRGPNDWVLGKVSTYRMDLSGQSGGERDGGSAPSEITFNDTVVGQLGIGEDAIAYGFSSDGTSAVIALPLTDITSSGAWWTASGDGSAVSAYAEDALGAWMNSATNGLSLMGLDDIHGESSPNADANPMIEWIDRAVEASDSRAHASRYTSLPKTLPANVKAVVRRAQAAGIPTKGSGYDNQVRVMRWLVDYFTAKDNHFTYSFDAPDGDGRSNMEVVDDFLDPETGHAGYCQHYASALAILARAMGVPTRIVLGYNAGSSDDRTTDGYRSVTSRQLHAWVEAYLDGVGWVPFDVTPASEENSTLADAASSSSQSGATSTDTSSTDAQSTQSDATDQSSTSTDASGTDASDSAADDGSADDSAAADAAASGSSASDGSVWGRFMTWFGALSPWGRVAIGLAGGLVLIALLVLAPRGLRWWRRRRCVAAARAAAGSPDDADLRSRAWRIAWGQVKREGRRRGVRWSSSDTDAVIAARIADEYRAGGDAPDVPSAGGGGKPRSGSAAGRDAPETVLRVARNAGASAFGGVPEPVGRLAHDLRRLFRS